MSTSGGVMMLTMERVKPQRVIRPTVQIVPKATTRKGRTTARSERKPR